MQQTTEYAAQVGEMAGVCQRKAVVVAETKASCETLLVQIVADKRVADDQEKQVALAEPLMAWLSCTKVAPASSDRLCSDGDR